MPSVSILGSTGVIGTLTLEVIHHLGEDFKVRALAAGTNVHRLADQIEQFQPELVSVQDEATRHQLMSILTSSRFRHTSIPDVGVGDQGLFDVADLPTDCVVSAIVGTRGLLPTWKALVRGATVLLANKETLVAAGDLVMDYCRGQGGRILPIDSEHSALYQSLHSGKMEEVEAYWVTASGGPFRTWTSDQISRATIHDALRHPTWTMGKKITVDSATLMNKGLEVIEAHHLFQAAYDSIKVVVHPQSIVHSMIEFRDGSCIAQLGTHDMRLPIQYALTYPDRLPSPWPKLDLIQLGSLSFEAPDFNRFPCLRLAFEAGREGGYSPCVLNAANEVAVARALSEHIPFAAIGPVVETVLSQNPGGKASSIDDVLARDAWARECAESVIRRGWWNR